MTATAAARRSRRGRARSMAASSSRRRTVSNASCTQAWTSSSLVGKTRKIVPSAMPAARAISRVLRALPFSRRRGMVAATIEARRASGVMAGARGVTRRTLSE